MRMSSTVFCAVIFLAALTFSAAQKSCKGRCGAEYYRGYMCQCDYTCLRYEECCKDYESQCTTKNSCKGRCGETFQRGRLCSCDSECVKYKQCCQDYQSNCHAGAPPTEEISEAASATAPMKTSSCDSVNDIKPKEAEEQPSTFNDADDHLIPLVISTSSPPDLSSDNNKIVLSDELSNNGVKDPETGPTPETTSGSGSTVNQLYQVSTEPTPEFSTETVAVTSQAETTPSKNEPTQADDSSSTVYTASREAPAESTDASDFVTSTVLRATVPWDAIGSVALPSTTVLESSGQGTEDDILPELQMINLTGASSPNPDVTVQPVTTVYYSPEASVSIELNYPGLETTQANTTPASATSDQIPTSEPITSNPEPEDVENAQHLTTSSDRSTDVTTAGSLSVHNVMTTHSPLSTVAVKDEATDDVTPPRTTADPAEATSEMATPQPSEATSKPQDQPDPYKPSPAKPSLAKTTLIPETKPLDTEQTLSTDDSRDYQADDSNDTNLCSGRPVGAVTTLRNGTIVVFRGHYFWFLDSNRVPGPARGITQVWGVPSPVDTVFTRCNCQGKTYIFKGPKYWRFENAVLDSGYPRVIETGFDGLRGHITAALSIPQYQRRRESVYFFKRGGFVQKYSYQLGTSPTCGTTGKYTIFTVPKRMARQAVSDLESPIDIKKSWRGFPSIVTAAVSVPNNREPEGYEYYIFSRSKSYNVRLDGEQPVIAPSKAKSPQSNNVFKCPKKV